MDGQGWKWALGLIYIIVVALIWIATSFIVQSVVDSGVSPLLITYICNSLFLVYIPMVEIVRYIEDSIVNSWFKWNFGNSSDLQPLGNSEKMTLINYGDSNTRIVGLNLSESVEQAQIVQHEFHIVSEHKSGHFEPELLVGPENSSTLAGSPMILEAGGEQLVAKGHWTRTRVAKISLLICPFWFLAQLTFNLSLKYTTLQYASPNYILLFFFLFRFVDSYIKSMSNTIMSNTSSLFTFLVPLKFLGQRFSWLKLFSVLHCMGGTVIVSLGDSKMGANEIASKPFLGGILALVSASLYAIYISLIRKKLLDEDKGERKRLVWNSSFYPFFE